MLDAEMKADGWLEHDGGPCPVAMDSRPSVMLGDGFITEPLQRAAVWLKDGSDSWQHEGPRKHHIIAYRPEPTP